MSWGARREVTLRERTAALAALQAAVEALESVPARRLAALGADDVNGALDLVVRARAAAEVAASGIRRARIRTALARILGGRL